MFEHGRHSGATDIGHRIVEFSSYLAPGREAFEDRLAVHMLGGVFAGGYGIEHVAPYLKVKLVGHPDHHFTNRTGNPDAKFLADGSKRERAPFALGEHSHAS